MILADLSIVTVSQDHTFLLDLHSYLPFALPFDPENIPRSWDWGETPTFRGHWYDHDRFGWRRYTEQFRAIHGDNNWGTVNQD